MFNSLNMTQHTSDNLDSSRQKISAIIKFESQYQIPFNKSKSIKIAEFVRSNTFKNIRSDKTPRYSFKNHLKPMVKAHHIFDFNDKEDLERILTIMKKSPKQRSDEDSKYLADAFHSIKFFIEAHEEIPEDLILKLYKELSHTFCLKRDKIFQIGDIGNKFYIILKGSVYVLLQKTGFRENVEESIEENNEDKFSNEEFKLIDDIISMNDIEKDGPFPNVENPKKIQALDYLKMQLHEFEKNYSKLTYCDKDNSTISKYVKKLWSLDSTSSNVNFSDDRIRFQSDFLNILNDKDYLSLLYPEMILSKELFTGDSFGELALRRSIPRTATIICREDTHLAILTKNSFNEILSQQYQNLYNQNFEFFQRIPLFKNWKVEYIEQFFFQLEMKTYCKNFILFDQEKQSKDIYFIKRGEIEISMDDSINNFKNTKAQTLNKNNRHGALRKENKKLAILGVGEIFGQEEMFFDSPAKFVALTLSEVQLFKISKEKFLTVVKNDKTLADLKETTRNILKWRFSKASHTIFPESIKNKSVDLKILKPNLEYSPQTNYVTNSSINTNYQNEVKRQISTESKEMYFTENENKNSKLKFSKCIKNINSKRIDSNDMSNMISLTHKCLEANFSHKKTNLLQDIIKINEKNKESNLLYVKNFFLNGNNNLAYLPNFAKKKQISYLNTNKDFSKAKNLIIKNVVSKRKKDVLRKVILENLKIQS